MRIYKNYNPDKEIAALRERAEKIRNGDTETIEQAARSLEHEANCIEETKSLISQVWAQLSSVEKAYSAYNNQVTEKELRDMYDIESVRDALKNYGFKEDSVTEVRDDDSGEDVLAGYTYVFKDDDGYIITVVTDSENSPMDVDDEDNGLEFDMGEWIEEEILSIERIDKDGEFAGVELTLCWGGPHVWLDTSDCRIYGADWGSRVEAEVDNEICEWLYDYFNY